MNLKFDLHVHSERSPDGVMPLEEIVALAKARGLNGIAVCDHDAVLPAVPRFENFLVIPATEVSTRYGHLLGLFVTESIDTRDFFSAVERIHAQEGLAVLAHPFEHSRDADRLDPVLPFLDGVEVWNARADRNNREANQMAAELAARHGLRPFAGSDAHVPGEVGNGFVKVDAPSLTPDAVKAALKSGEVAISGTRSAARFVAASQLTKLKKKHAGLPAYAKWGLFALKCAAQDLLN